MSAGFDWMTKRDLGTREKIDASVLLQEAVPRMRQAFDRLAGEHGPLAEPWSAVDA